MRRRRFFTDLHLLLLLPPRAAEHELEAGPVHWLTLSSVVISTNNTIRLFRAAQARLRAAGLAAYAANPKTVVLPLLRRDRSQKLARKDTDYVGYCRCSIKPAKCVVTAVVKVNA